MPFGTRAPRASKRFESRRKSTTSCSSALTSCSPATSSQWTFDRFPVGVSLGVARGMTLTTRQSR